MCAETLTKAMKAAISDVLETMFFMTAQFDETGRTLKEWLSDKQLLFGASMRFSGPSSGLLWLIAPVSTLDDITANFLGIGKEEINDEQRSDTVKEALNMIGGHGFSMLDRKDTFALGIPYLVEGLKAIEDMRGASSVGTILIDIGNNHLAAGAVVD
jgi:hypothetical protein